MDAEINDKLIRLRQELGSQEAYAELLGVSVRSVRNWEGGRVVCPSNAVLARMHRLHHTSTPQQLGFHPRIPDQADTSTSPEADVHRRDVLALATAAAFGTAPLPLVGHLLSAPDNAPAIGSADIRRVNSTNTTLAGADFLIGGAAFDADTLLSQFRTAAQLLHGRYQQQATRARMHSAVAHLGSTIGFMLFDTGRYQQATTIYTASLRIATDAHDRWPLRAIIFSEMARQALHLHQPEQATELLHLAAGASTHLSPTGHAMLHALSARAHAARGDLTSTRLHTRLAEDTFATARPRNDPEWIAWFTLPELDGETGAATTTLALHHDAVRDDAIARLTRAAAACQPTDQRSKTLNLTRAASLHAARRAPAPTAATIRAVLAAAQHLKSPRITTELDALHRQTAPLNGHYEVAEVRRDLHAWINRSTTRAALGSPPHA